LFYPSTLLQGALPLNCCELSLLGCRLQANAVSDKLLDLRKCNYSGKNLSGKTLAGALLSETDMSNTNLTEAVLTKVRHPAGCSGQCMHTLQYSLHAAGLVLHAQDSCYVAKSDACKTHHMAAAMPLDDRKYRGWVRRCLM
jgi:hypothetical protein